MALFLCQWPFKVWQSFIFTPTLSEKITDVKSRKTAHSGVALRFLAVSNIVTFHVRKPSPLSLLNNDRSLKMRTYFYGMYEKCDCFIVNIMK